MFDIEDYNYDLPPELIAQVPAAERDHSRLLFANRSEKAFSEHCFFELPGLLQAGDLLVINDTRVVPARLRGFRATGGRVEILVLDHPVKPKPHADIRWCLIKSSKRPKQGDLLLFDSGVSGRVVELSDEGPARIDFSGNQSIDDLLENCGEIPLPPYIKRRELEVASVFDRERYQTVFGLKRGAVAAPTAGLHFTDRLLQQLRRSGIDIHPITLHVGYGTFRSVRTKDIRHHRLGEEPFEISRSTAQAVTRRKTMNGRVIAVGTTVVRALESAVKEDGSIRWGQGKTDLMIAPGFSFRVVDGLITNFHLPKSSLLFLVSAFAGIELIREAYRLAILKKYRFYSYGDAMLLL
jgi:S-adenosylmethionine:tRNA ribosyltransferase-isomerase